MILPTDPVVARRVATAMALGLGTVPALRSWENQMHPLNLPAIHARATTASRRLLRTGTSR